MIDRLTPEGGPGDAFNAVVGKERRYAGVATARKVSRRMGSRRGGVDVVDWTLAKRRLRRGQGRCAAAAGKPFLSHRSVSLIANRVGSSASVSWIRVVRHLMANGCVEEVAAVNSAARRSPVICV